MTPTRSHLRQALLTARQAWADGPEVAQAQHQLHARLMEVLSQLEPTCLGVYWPVRGEFNPRPLALEAQASLNCRLALPWASKAACGADARMSYRQWQGEEPDTRDECGIACPDTAPAQPDVVLVPCLGFTRQGYRLGYGGGYFDRYLAAHPHLTSVGVAWSQAALADGDFEPEAHDLALTLIVTPDGVVG